MNEPTFQSRCLSKFSAEIEAAAEKMKRDPEGNFIVFVDGMDGDVYENWIDATCAVTHAFRHGAKEVALKKFGD